MLQMLIPTAVALSVLIECHCSRKEGDRQIARAIFSIATRDRDKPANVSKGFCGYFSQHFFSRPPFAHKRPHFDGPRLDMDVPSLRQTARRARASSQVRHVREGETRARAEDLGFECAVQVVRPARREAAARGPVGRGTDEGPAGALGRLRRTSSVGALPQIGVRGN